MLPVFDKKNQTPLAVKEQYPDRKLASGGSLSLGGITSASALANNNGVDTNLVHGTRSQHVIGTQNTKITVDRNHTVLGSQRNSVLINRTDTTTAHRTLTTTGGTNRTQVGPTNDTYVQAHTIDHSAPQNVQEPTSFMHYIKTAYNAYTQKTNIGNYYMQAYWSYQSWLGQFTDVKGIYAQATGVAASFTGINLHAEPIDNGARAMRNELDVMKDDIFAHELDIAAMKTHPTAVTLKMIVLGINQWM